VLSTIEGIYGLGKLNSAIAISDAFNTTGGVACNSGIVDSAPVSCATVGLPGDTGTAYTQVYTTYSGGGTCTQAPAPGYDTSHCVAPSNSLTNGVPVTGVSGAKASNKIWTITVPAGRSSLTINTSGGVGNCDLYVQLNAAPTTRSYLQRSKGPTNNETITINAPVAGTYYVMVHGYSSYSGVTLVAND